MSGKKQLSDEELNAVCGGTKEECMDWLERNMDTILERINAVNGGFAIILSLILDRGNVKYDINTIEDCKAFFKMYGIDVDDLN